jgi:hypothetical protein
MATTDRQTLGCAVQRALLALLLFGLFIARAAHAAGPVTLKGVRIDSPRLPAPLKEAT